MSRARLLVESYEDLSKGFGILSFFSAPPRLSRVEELYRKFSTITRLVWL